MNTSITLPKDVFLILKKLNSNSFEAYVVGGCVRDWILGRQPYDWDITTSAQPHQIKKIFTKTIDTGLQHGTVTVVFCKGSYEVTTFRTDGEYIDNRHPEEVFFTSSIREDLARRDFTINAAAYHPETGVIDPFGGIPDIERKIIRTVGDPDRRFKEDALRMLRAIRFSAQLNFEVEQSTMLSICRNSGTVTKISIERIRDELTKILISNNPGSFSLLKDTGLIRHVIPEFEQCFLTDQNHPYHIHNVAFHSLEAVAAIAPETHLRWAMLLHDIGKTVTKTTDKQNVDHFYGHSLKSVMLSRIILRRMKFDNKTVDIILRLIENHDRRIEPTPCAVRKAICSVGKDIFCDLIKVQKADKKAQNPLYLKERLDSLTSIEKIYKQISDNRQCVSLKELALKGNDLKSLGIQEGREIGDILLILLDKVIEDPELNKKEKLLRLVNEIKNNIL